MSEASKQSCDPDYSPEFQDEYQRLWHREAAKARLYKLALDRIDAVRIPGDGERNAAERAYFDAKTIVTAALRPETPIAALVGVPAALEVLELARETSNQEPDPASERDA
jgi:hypothetical protein